MPNLWGAQVQTWKLFKKLYYLPHSSNKKDTITAKSGIYTLSNAIEMNKSFDIMPAYIKHYELDDKIKLIENFCDIGSKELQMILKIDNLDLLWVMRDIFIENYELFKENCDLCPKELINRLLIPNSKSLDSLEENFVDRLLNGFVPSKDLVSDLLTCNGEVQYRMLSFVLRYYETLSNEIRSIIIKLLMESPEWWIGASIGVMTDEDYKTQLRENVLELIMDSIETNGENHAFIGALLAEMMQIRHDPEFKFNTYFESLLNKISKDKEAIVYAELWMDYTLKNFGYFDENYWDNIKKYLHTN